MSESYFKHYPGGDTVFTVDNSKLKIGKGALKEVGYDVKQLNIKKLGLYTDPFISQQECFKQVKESLNKYNINFEIYDQILVEPTDESLKEAIDFTVKNNFDGFVTVGGGSVIDTTKAANLYSTYPDDLLAYVNAPLGQAKKIPGPLKPLIACTTTFGTASECTAISVFDYLPLKAKTGIMHPALRPVLGILDPTSLYSLPKNVVAANGFDVFSHACESYTARPYTRRPVPEEPNKRPATQGANPFGDVACLEAIRIMGRVLVDTVNGKGEAREKGLDELMLAGTLAGIGFGNTGCHIPHGMSYAVSGLVKDYKLNGWPEKHPLIPHGLSVIVNSPAVFRNYAKYCPERHLNVVKAIGDTDPKILEGDISLENAGDVLADKIVEMAQQTGLPNGLSALGYNEDDLDALTEATFPQKRLLDNSPKPEPVTKEDLRKLFQESLTMW